jgi:hypothetical protein
VRKHFEPRQSEKAAGAFDAVDEPKDIIENLGVVRFLFEAHQLGVDQSMLSPVSVRNSRSRSSMEPVLSTQRATCRIRDPFGAKSNWEVSTVCCQTV